MSSIWNKAWNREELDQWYLSVASELGLPTLGAEGRSLRPTQEQDFRSVSPRMATEMPGTKALCPPESSHRRDRCSLLLWLSCQEPQHSSFCGKHRSLPRGPALKKQTPARGSQSGSSGPGPWPQGPLRLGVSCTL